MFFAVLEQSQLPELLCWNAQKFKIQQFPGSQSSSRYHVHDIAASKILLFLPPNSCLWGFSSLNLVIKIEMKYFFIESVGLFRKGGLFTLISNVYKKGKTIKICFNLEFSNLFYNFLKYKVSTPQGFFQAFFISGKQFKLSFKNSVYDQNFFSLLQSILRRKDVYKGIKQPYTKRSYNY